MDKDLENIVIDPDFIFYLIDNLNEFNFDKYKELFLNNYNNINSLFVNNTTTAYIYAASKSLNSLKLLHQFYLDIKYEIPDVYKEPYEIKNKKGCNLLHFIINNIIVSKNYNKTLKKKYNDILHYILHQIKVNVNSLNHNKETALSLVVKYNKTDIVKLLLYYGASTNILSKSKKTPLMYAIQNNYNHMFKSIIYKSQKYNLNTELKFIKKSNCNFKKKHLDELTSTMHYYKQKYNNNIQRKNNKNCSKEAIYKEYVKYRFSELVKLEKSVNMYKSTINLLEQSYYDNSELEIPKFDIFQYTNINDDEDDEGDIEVIYENNFNALANKLNIKDLDAPNLKQLISTKMYLLNKNFY
jgi:ankyrin repeat protein